MEINAVTRYTFRGEKFFGITKLINLGGVLLEGEEALALGSQISVTLNLPLSLDLFCATGEVVYRHNTRGRRSHVANEMGVKFLNIEGNGVALLEEFTKRYAEFNPKHSVYSKEMSTFHDPTILSVPKDNSEE